jgi:amidase
MHNDHWPYASATEIARLIRGREVSAEEVITAHLARIEALNPLLNAVIQIAPESAVEQARAVDAALARGEAVGPLAGVPFTVKDVFPVKDAARLVPIQGMAPLLDLPGDRDATAIVRLREAGAILIARTRATIWKDRMERYGPVHNPFDLTADAHGSSGGEAAIIAAEGSPLGLGSDSGGSLRHPAERCGIVALRPSNGRVPRGVDAAGTNDPRTVAGPLARRVEDVAVALEIISGVDPYDATTLPLPLRDWRNVEITGLRVAIFDDYSFHESAPEQVAAVRDAAKALEDAGASVDEISPPNLAEAWQITLDYWSGTDAMGIAAVYDEFLARWDRFRIAMALYMQDLDLIITPVGPSVYPAVFSLVGWPAAVVRIGTWPGTAMPIGVQVVGKPWLDDVALAAAARIEAVYGGWRAPVMGDNGVGCN